MKNSNHIENEDLNIDNVVEMMDYSQNPNNNLLNNPAILPTFSTTILELLDYESWKRMRAVNKNFYAASSLTTFNRNFATIQLTCAVKNRDVNAVEKWLNKGADVNVTFRKLKLNLPFLSSTEATISNYNLLQLLIYKYDEKIIPGTNADDIQICKLLLKQKIDITHRANYDSFTISQSSNYGDSVTSEVTHDHYVESSLQLIQRSPFASHKELLVLILLRDLEIKYENNAISLNTFIKSLCVYATRSEKQVVDYVKNIIQTNKGLVMHFDPAVFVNHKFIQDLLQRGEHNSNCTII